MTTSTIPRTTRPGLATCSLVICAFLILAACGGSPTTSSARSSSASSSPAAPTSSSTASAASSPAAAGTASPVPVESNPPGDIPDNLAFVPYANRPGGYSFTHPEGWARTGNGTRVRFTDKLNGVAVVSTRASQAPSLASARRADVPRLKGSVPAFELRGITRVTVPSGTGVRIVFRRNSDPDPVTNKVFRDEVEEYLVFRSGRLIRMDLFGPVGADNVDAYRTMSESLSIR